MKEKWYKWKHNCSHKYRWLLTEKFTLVMVIDVIRESDTFLLKKRALSKIKCVLDLVASYYKGKTPIFTTMWGANCFECSL